MRRKKWLLALGLACPACAGSFVLVMGAAFGLSAALVKGSLLMAGVTVLGFLWIRNILRRRGEDACPLPVAPPGVSAAQTATANLDPAEHD